MRQRNRVIVGLIVAGAFVAGLVAAPAVEHSSDGSFGLRTFGTATSADEPPATAFDAGTFRRIAEAQMPMVVNIRTESRQQTRALSDFFRDNQLLERFFQFHAPEPREYVTEGAGTGFVIDVNGTILTNHHVVQGATKITVALYADEAGAEYAARVVGRDPLTDSALIELTEKPDHALPIATLGKSADIQPGDWVLAVGNPFNLAHTVTVGVISATDRPFPISEGRWQDVLQTDAAINPGNSGGPLLNLRGEVVGMNTAILSNPVARGNVGVGFAIPIDTVSELLPDLRRGTITRGRIGVQITPVTRDLVEPLKLESVGGALVRQVDRGGPAAAAGIEPGDVIVSYNGQAVTDSDELVKAVARTEPGKAVPVQVVRAGERKTLDVTVAELEMDDADRETHGPTETGFGMTLREATPDVARRLNLPQGRTGALVAEVESTGSAARAGIQAGDVILEVNRSPVKNVDEAVAALKQSAQRTGFVLVWRSGQEVFVTLPPRN